MVSNKKILKISSYVLLMVAAILLVCTDVWAASNAKPAMVNRIDFIAGENGTSTLIVGTTADVKYDMQTEGGNKLRLVLDNTVIPTYRRRVLVTSNFDSAVNRILPVQSTEADNTAYLLIDLRENVPYTIDKAQDTIRINFNAASPAVARQTGASSNFESIPAAYSANPQASQQPNKISGTINTPQPTYTTSSSPAPGETTIAYGGSSKKTYSGTPIALDFYETDIRNVIRILQEVSGRNFAVDRNVVGVVTLSFKKPVPWDQVLDLVLTMNQLTAVDDGDIIRIATVRTVADESEARTQALFRASALADAETKATAFIPVYYAKASELAANHINPWLEEVKQTIKDRTGGGSGSSSNKGDTDMMVTADNRLNTLVVNAPQRIIEQIRAMVVNLDKVTPQVLIEARIIEANSSFTRELGIDWGEINIGAFSLFGLGNIDLSFGANNIPTSLLADDAGGGSMGFNFSKIGGTSFDIIGAQIKASESEGLTNVLSAPRILTLNTEKAMIKQGLEVPYLERDDSGGSSVQWKDVDLLLEVTPNITLDNRVTLEIYITKNEIEDRTAEYQSLLTNEARTKFMVDDGDTVVIGGILKSNRSNNETGVPGLRSLSLLGWLFQSERVVESKNELLIFITPKIITLDSKQKAL